jgi:hypothetical protein
MLDSAKPELIRAAAASFYFDALRFPRRIPAESYYCWKPDITLLMIANSAKDFKTAFHLMARAANGSLEAEESIILELRAYRRILLILSFTSKAWHHREQASTPNAFAYVTRRMARALYSWRTSEEKKKKRNP